MQAGTILRLNRLFKKKMGQGTGKWDEGRNSCFYEPGDKEKGGQGEGKHQLSDFRLLISDFRLPTVSQLKADKL